MFPEKAHRLLVDGGTVVGLTLDSAPIFLKEHVAYKGVGFFTEFRNEDMAFGFYASCIDFNEDFFIFYPSSQTKESIPGFGLENERFRKESLVKLGTSSSFCCIGSTNSFKELSIPKNIKEGATQQTFKVGHSIDIAVVSETFFSVGYKKCNTTTDPGTYSLRGDVLDVFPYHFRNPFRFSFNFDKIESIALYDPNTQLTIKQINKLSLFDYKEGLKTIDNIDVIEHSGLTGLILVSVLGEDVSLTTGSKNMQVDLGLKKINLSGKTANKRAQSALSLSLSASKRVFVGKKDGGSLEFFEPGYFTDVEPGSTNFSFLSEMFSTAIISENDINSIKRTRSRWSPLLGQERSALDKNSIARTSVGDFVVHRDFGIGVYQGIKTKNYRESIEIEYGNNTLVYVSLEQISLVHRYVGSGKKPKVSTLGSKKWASEVKRAKIAAENVAIDVFRGYSNKTQPRSFSYTKENDLDGLLSQSFSFIETPDQKTAINDVFSDMNSSTPMDRLICGDVGFGKTEVAIRAIFKAFLSDRVSVFLCPTTILADQHYMTCHERLGTLGVSISLLSRFKSKTEQTEIINNLKMGKIDVLIGTHRVLSGDVDIPNLGLLIIDEEHRFGVKHKETIKKIRDGVDVLTLTATPIPRTLQQTLVGLKDVSIMLTPPKARRPILTTVRYFNWSLVFSRIEFELSRSGQVYFLNNDITSIPSIVDRLSSRFPNFVVAGASGKMKSKDLEAAVLSFFKGEINILVCTTIIESGLDVTNANSIIIKDAQNFGLAQLYQIRGRVGRGDRQAYCHLLVPRTELDRSAFKRLRSLEKNTALGSGYNISMQDLEIRGAGTVFGHKQSGHMSLVGFQMYCDLLSEEIKKRTSPDNINHIAPQIKTSLPANIEETYIESMSSRVDFYYKIGTMSTQERIETIKKELVDVFGPTPISTKNLIAVAELKTLYKKTPFIYINHESKRIELIANEIEKKLLPSFLSKVSGFAHPQVINTNFRDKKDGRIRVDINLLKVPAVFDVLFSFARLFDVINKG
tara:strand:- start:3548 stop:6625 length:3078 start_codon:yes stop_codon:yes gene_type:complete